MELGNCDLAAYMLDKKEEDTLDSYLESPVFCRYEGLSIEPDKKDVEGFEQFMSLYTAGLAIER